MKILIVDDEEGVRISLKKVLERDGYEVLLADRGAEGIEIVRKFPEDIETVISDFKMPGMDGLETLTEIGRINPDIIRIILTGYATLDRAIETVNLGIDGFLTKPFDNKEIRAKIREFVIKKRLKQFVPDQVLQEMQRTGKQLAPRKQIVSVLFTDIRGFAEMSSKMSAQEIADILNKYYFLPLDRIVFEYNGTLDKHIGDSIMAIFGAPLSYKDDAFRAISCAVKMRETMTEINKILSRENSRIPIGIGIATGEVMVGMFGSPIKKEYTVLGTPVNLASRLERIAAEDQILICKDTFRIISDAFKTQEINNVSLKGIEGGKSIFEVIGTV
ncbi:MAG: response regulator [Deltaproteobacteria bacterium]|nr:response regulator [Deltaproteobacteria bacterium]